MIRILGIDPGSRITGYGVIDVDGRHSVHVCSGSLRVGSDSLPGRLGNIFQRITGLVDEYAPAEMAIEQVFMHRNAESALKLGQARGVAICACATRLVPVSEYSPREVKQAVVGKGSASKEQVQHMVRVILNLPSAPQADAADALAIALCHGHSREAIARIPEARQLRRGRLR